MGWRRYIPEMGGRVVRPPSITIRTDGTVHVSTSLYKALKDHHPRFDIWLNSDSGALALAASKDGMFKVLGAGTDHKSVTNAFKALCLAMGYKLPQQKLIVLAVTDAQAPGRFAFDLARALRP